MTAPERELLAYLAGAIDSGGSIQIVKRQQQCGALYTERIAVARVVDDVPLLLQETFGGHILATKPSFANGRAVVRWIITAAAAGKCLRAMCPYLRVKTEQAKNVLAFRELMEASKKERPRQQELSDAMEACYQKAKALNNPRTC